MCLKRQHQILFSSLCTCKSGKTVSGLLFCKYGIKVVDLVNLLSVLSADFPPFFSCFPQFTDTSKEPVHPQCPPWQHLERRLLLMNGWSGAVAPRWLGYVTTPQQKLRHFNGLDQKVTIRLSEILHRMGQCPNSRGRELIHSVLCRISSGKAGCFYLDARQVSFYWRLDWVWFVPRGSCSLLLLCNKPPSVGYQ